MKKLSLVLVTLVAVSCMMLTSCKKDKLDGTTWTSTISEEGISVALTLAFEDGEFDYTASFAGMSQTMNGTYTYADPKVTLTATVDGETSSIEGTVSGDKLTLTQDGESITFTKQK